jgi:regulator-associated protein of mTOR
MTHWNHKRHGTGGNPRQRNPADAPDWRMRERLRTVTAALVMCLNIGVDPPDVSKTNPCSKLLCWMDPSSLEVSKALPAIGKNLQAQFETLSMKTRYKQYLDPIVEETKRFCTSLRRTAKDERVLFYYNGFGVPKPTPGGEIWVFNKAYTQYIPVTLFDLQNWLGSPCIFVWDASSAGNVVVNFKRLAERRAEEERANGGGSSQPQPQPGASAQHFPLRESIHLAACAPDEVLPMNPDLPADLFTCCLTSPIEISLRWFVLQNPLPSRLNVDMVMNIPGRLQDRRTPLGELNWIFTAITDTIAWTVLPRAIFRRLFRDDLMVAALLRNFLLAERIMRFYHCTPMSHPKLPPTHNHPLWDSWDLAVDQCLAQLPTLLEKEKAQADAANGGPPVPPHLAAFEYRHSSFFSEQLKAFEVWLSQGGVSRKGRRRRVDATSLAIRHGVTGIPHAGSSASSAAGTVDEEDEATARPQRDPPDQLPIVLQVLLSQVHRLRALILLSQFLDLGPWAVNLALSIGIFPYVLKLLQSPAADLKPVLIYIWARILAVDRSCQNDLLRDSGFVYFAGVLSPFSPSTSANAAAAGVAGNGNALPIPNVSEHRAMCAFILAIFCQDFPAGQAAALETDAMDSCLEHLEDEDFLLRQWSALCLAQLWDESAAGKARGLSKDAQGKLCMMLADASPEVRAAVLYALGTLLGASGSSFDPLDPLTTSPAAKHTGGQRARCLGTGTATGLSPADQRSLEVNIAVTMLVTRGDCSPMVRKELVVALSPLIREYQGFFVVAAYLYYEREDRRHSRRARTRSTGSRTTQSYDAQEEQDEDDAVIRRIIERLPAEYKLEEADEANIAACSTIFTALLDLSADAYPEVASLTCTILDYIVALMRESGVGRIAENTTLRFGAGAGDATHRLVTPKATNLGAEGYFSYTPRRASQDIAGHAFTFGASSTAATTLNSNGYSSLRSPGRPAARRAPSLAQTVKAIATLGYSRPSSPVGSPDEDSGIRSPGSAAGSAQHSGSATPALAARVPAPSFNLAQYVSPYAHARRSTTPTTPETPRSPSATLPTSSSTAALVAAAHRSSSAESLAAIARMQARRGNTSGSTTPGGTISSPLAERHPTPSSAALAPPQMTGAPEKDDAKAVAALANLVAADLQRFKDRAALGAELAAAGVPPGAAGLAASSAGNTPMASPSMTRTSTRDGNHSSVSSAASSPGGNVGLREVLPLKSRLFSWCAEYYTEPQMKSAEAEEPGSVKYNVQTWKRQRNERLVSESQAHTDHAGSTPWTDNIGTIKNGAPPYLMLMHQFESHLVTASEQDTISVWDWERQRLLSRFRNGNPEKTNVTSAAFVNEDVDALLLIGSAEGDVRLYSNYDESPTHVAGSGPKLVSTFRALPDLARTKRPAGLIVDWQQVTGHLLAAGDSGVVRVWDAHRELCVCDIPTHQGSSVTSLTSEYDVGHIFVAGFSDGTVGVYDRRNPPEASLVRLWTEHSTWVQNVHLQRRGNRELLSAR